MKYTYQTENVNPCFLYLFVSTILITAIAVWAAPPHFESVNGHKVLMVHDKPFLLLGVEGHGTADLQWAAQHHCNHFKTLIHWNEMESTQGQYDWTVLDAIINNARANKAKVHLVYLGFNRGGEAERFVPDYIKSNPGTYQPVVDANGQPVGWHWGNSLQLCANDPQTLDREVKMMQAMFAHIRDIDSAQQTVIAVQVLNEVGNHEVDRCHCGVCNALYSQGNWTDGIEFYAWSIANHIEELAKAGRAIYDIPCNINTFRPGSSQPFYNSEPHRHRQLYLDTAPHIDLIGLDTYPHSMSAIGSALGQYRFGRNIVYLAETTTDQPKSAEFFIYKVICELGGIGQSAWSVSTCFPKANTATPYIKGSQAGIELSKAYKAIGAAMAPIAIYRNTTKLTWFLPIAATSFTRQVNGVTLNLTTANEQGKGLIIQPEKGVMDFTLVGNDYTVELPDLAPGKPLQVEKGKWDGNTWIAVANVAFNRRGGKVIVIMPQACAIRVQGQSSALSDLKLDLTSLSFSATQGLANPSSRKVIVTAIGDLSLDSLSVIENAGWLAVSVSGTDSIRSLTNKIDITGLTPNTYSTTVTASAEGASKTYSVHLVVLEHPKPIVTPFRVNSGGKEYDHGKGNIRFYDISGRKIGQQGKQNSEAGFLPTIKVWPWKRDARMCFRHSQNRIGF